MDYLHGFLEAINIFTNVCDTLEKPIDSKLSLQMMKRTTEECLKKIKEIKGDKVKPKETFEDFKSYNDENLKETSEIEYLVCDTECEAPQGGDWSKTKIVNLAYYILDKNYVEIGKRNFIPRNGVRLTRRFSSKGNIGALDMTKKFLNHLSQCKKIYFFNAEHDIERIILTYEHINNEMSSEIENLLKEKSVCIMKLTGGTLEDCYEEKIGEKCQRNDKGNHFALEDAKILTRIVQSMKDKLSESENEVSEENLPNLEEQNI